MVRPPPPMRRPPPERAFSPLRQLGAARSGLNLGLEAPPSRAPLQPTAPLRGGRSAAALAQLARARAMHARGTRAALQARTAGGGGAPSDGAQLLAAARAVAGRSMMRSTRK